MARSDQRDLSGPIMREVCVAPPKPVILTAMHPLIGHTIHEVGNATIGPAWCRMRGCLETEGIVADVSATCRCLPLSIKCVCSR
ncbi:hypothetical protein CGRA01v4_02993 [Colletotrichum graminicola]|nr:hypothetical protein CGRA01v4_02993 [Colletotrichum graminicola]